MNCSEPCRFSELQLLLYDALGFSLLFAVPVAVAYLYLKYILAAVRSWCACRIERVSVPLYSYDPFFQWRWREVPEALCVLSVLSDVDSGCQFFHGWHVAYSRHCVAGRRV
jgi:hypothetical protein